PAIWPNPVSDSKLVRVVSASHISNRFDAQQGEKALGILKDHKLAYCRTSSPRCEIQSGDIDEGAEVNSNWSHRNPTNRRCIIVAVNAPTAGPSPFRLERQIP